MTTMQKVERVYSHESTKITDTKTKHHDYKNGGFRTEVRQTVITYGLMYSLLSCGHTRQWQAGENFANSKRLSCHYCDSIIWRANLLAKVADPIERGRQIEWLAEAESAACGNAELVAEHATTWLAYD